MEATRHWGPLALTLMQHIAEKYKNSKDSTTFLSCQYKSVLQCITLIFNFEYQYFSAGWISHRPSQPSMCAFPVLILRIFSCLKIISHWSHWKVQCNAIQWWWYQPSPSDPVCVLSLTLSALDLQWWADPTSVCSLTQFILFHVIEGPSLNQWWSQQIICVPCFEAPQNNKG